MYERKLHPKRRVGDLGAWRHVRHRERVRRFAIAALIAVLGIGFALPRRRSRPRRRPSRAAPRPAIRPPALAPVVPHGATRLGAMTATQPLTIEVVLQPSNAAALASLSARAVRPRFVGIRALAHARTVRAARSDRARPRSPRPPPGCTRRASCRRPSNGFAVRASGDAQYRGAGARRLVRARTHSPDGTSGYVASAAPLVPAALAPAITTITGLSDAVHFDNHLDLHPSGTGDQPAARERVRPLPRGRARGRVHLGPRLREQRLLDARPGREHLRRARPPRAGHGRAGEDHRHPRARAEPAVRHEPLPLLHEAPHPGGRSQDRRRRLPPTSSGPSKPRSTSRRPRPTRRARRSVPTKRRTTQWASTTRTTR